MSTAQSERSRRTPEPGASRDARGPDRPATAGLAGSPEPDALGRRLGRHGGSDPGEPQSPASWPPGDEPSRRRRGSWSWSWRTVAVVVVVVTTMTGAIVLRGYLPQSPRVVVYGDSLMVEAQEDFRAAADQAGAHAILMKMWSGTAPCNWLGDVPTTIRDFQPTVAVIAFSGNRSECMSGRDFLGGYRADVTAMVDQLVAGGVEVRLVEAPPRAGEDVDATGRTPLDQVWARIAAATPHVSVIRAGQAVSDHGRFSATLPCDPGEPCGPDGRVVVRAPDGVHLCPHPDVSSGVCTVYSGGARRYGLAIAHGLFG